MNEQKDKGQIATISGKDLLDVMRLSPAEQYVVRKAERLVSAVYMLTDLFPQDEVLKTKIRNEALAIMSLITSIKVKKESERQKLFQRVIQLILRLNSHFTIASATGMVSEMNANILTKECARFVDHVQKLSQENSQNNQGSIATDILTDQEDKKDFHIESQNMPTQSPKNNIFKSEKNQNQIPKRKSTGTRKAKRREAILDILKRKGKVSVNDVSKELPGCSQKTVQRELLALVDQGQIEKEGERRWSTYSLVNM